MSFVKKLIGVGDRPASDLGIGGQQAAAQYGQTQADVSGQRTFTSRLGKYQTPAINAQGQLLQALQQQAMGDPNSPLAIQMATQTGANTANQAALMAGQRGTSGNAGLLARQAAMIGAQNQQQQVGQNAQAQIAAQQAAAQQAAQILGQRQQAINSLSQSSLGLSGQAMGQAQAQNAAQQQAYNSDLQFGGQILGSLAGSAAAAGVKAMAHGGQVQEEPIESLSQAFLAFDNGGYVPGKAQHSGDTLKNDTVPAMLSPGEVVIPRSIVQGKDAPKKAAAFVAAVLARKGK
jgi:hypothetical protein